MLGTSVEQLPFPSDAQRQPTVRAIQGLLGRGESESESKNESESAIVHLPHYALAAAVVAAPNLSMHLELSLSVGVHRSVLLSFRAVGCIWGKRSHNNTELWVAVTIDTNLLVLF